MKLVRYGAVGAEKPGIIDRRGGVRDLSSEIDDISPTVLSPRALNEIACINPDDLLRVQEPVRLGAPLARIGKIIGVGLNYRSHAQECGFSLPTEPTLFLKATSALSGPHDGVILPKGASRLDWEVELAVVIGTGGANIAQLDAPKHVAGYCLAIDFSERSFQFDRGGQGFKGKSADSFGPLGPWFVPSNEVDSRAVGLRLSVNGRVRQEASTSDLIFDVCTLISYASEFMSLQTGDVILTGTPAGVGMGQDPPEYLSCGDIVEATGTNLGRQTHVVRPAFA